MATKTTPPPEAETPDPTPPTAPAGNRFFAWMRGLGVTREPGWIGGVCAGIAARLGIDPLIVRGIVVVVAVLGGPALLLYAAAWLLLPDSKDKIHLEELIRGRLESPLAGIGAMVLLSLLPIAQGIWYTGALYWGHPAWGDSIGRAIWTLVVLAAIVVFVVWVARRSSASEPIVTPATTDDRPETIPQPVVASTTPAPKAPAPGAPAEEVAAWRAQQEAWKAERETFRASQAQAARETARQRAQESRERHQASLAAAAEHRRAWLAANPRAGAAYSAIALGAAALAGGFAAVALPEQPVTAGLAVAAIVLGLAIVVAGVIRRRSGFLAFVSVLVLAATLLSAVVPNDRTIVPTSWGVSNAVPGRYLQPLGQLYVTVDPALGSGTIDVVQGAGDIDVSLLEGSTTRIEITSQRGEVWLANDPNNAYMPLSGRQFSDGAWHFSQVFGTGTPTVTIRITQGPGSIVITTPETDPKS